jgi:hypothetical protein
MNHSLLLQHAIRLLQIIEKWDPDRVEAFMYWLEENQNSENLPFDAEKE